MTYMKDENRCFAIYFRTNKRVQWRFSKYAGRWNSIEEAIENLQSRINGEKGEYLIENMSDGTKFIGSLN